MIQAGNYSLKNLVLFSETNFLDISPVFSEINIFESIFSPTISGYIVVTDANNIISGQNSLPILGNEGLFLELEVPQHKYYDPESKEWKQPSNAKIRYFGRIFDIRNRTMLNERSQTYELHFVSEEAVLDRNMRISKSFKDKTIDTIVETILKDFGTGSSYEIEKTTNITNVVIPNWNPLYTINWLSSRSISSSYNTSTFFFYQTLYNDGEIPEERRSYNRINYSTEFTSKFWFISLDDMLAYDPKKTIFFRPGNIPDTINNDSINNSEYSNAFNYSIVNSFNTIENNATGLFNNTLITHDITTKTWKKIPFNYEKEYDKFQHLGLSKIYSGMKNISNKRFDDQTYRESKILMNSLGTYENPNHLDRISSSRMSRLSSLAYFRIKIVVPGDGSLESGDVIHFNLPSPESAGENKFDKYYNGKYLITAIRHVITRQSYNMTIECSKESLEKDIKNNA